MLASKTKCDGITGKPTATIWNIHEAERTLCLTDDQNNSDQAARCFHTYLNHPMLTSTWMIAYRSPLLWRRGGHLFSPYGLFNKSQQIDNFPTCIMHTHTHVQTHTKSFLCTWNIACLGGWVTIRAAKHHDEASVLLRFVVKLGQNSTNGKPYGTQVVRLLWGSRMSKSTSEESSLGTEGLIKLYYWTRWEWGGPLIIWSFSF